VADLLDRFKPGHIEPEKTAPYGGVCQPTAVVPPSLPAPATPPITFGAVPAAPGSPAGPPPAAPQGPAMPAPDFGVPSPGL